jgi:hypothetical protein
MGADLAAFLAAFGAAMDGDGLSWSVGGPPPMSLATLGFGLLGQPQGISGSHNKYEADSSPTRGDLYQFGNNFKLQMRFFQELYDLQANAPFPNYDLDVLGQHRSVRWDQSVNENPYFFSGVFTGLQVSNAAFTVRALTPTPTPKPQKLFPIH